MSTFSLVLRPAALFGSSDLTFSFACMLTSGVSFSASITVNANSPPRPGLFACSPPAGLVLSTDFSFSAELWGDPDLTLSYQFSYLTSTGWTLVLRLRFLLSYHSSVRPSCLLDHKRSTYRWSRL